MGEIVVNRNGSVHLYLVERNSRTIKSAVLSQELLADDSVNVKVESKTALDLKINDYIFIDGLTYRLNQLPSVTKNSENNFEYDLIFQGLMFDLKRCKFFNADANDFKTELEFPLIGDLEFFLIVVRNNMRRFSIDWEIGNFPANTETKSLSFSSDNCLSALQKICQEYKVEFWIKQENGKFKIHTGAFGNTIPTTLEYGKGNGLYSLSRKNVNENDIVSRLYVNGGSTNIPNEYRGFSKNLLMPNSAYLEDTALINEIGLIEGSITFEDIYPKRTGVISALGNSVFKFSDSSMDFDLNEKEADGITTKYLISGTTAKIYFNTGNLAGYQFEIKKGGYDNDTKTFEIIPFTNEQGQKFPDENSQAFQFSVGDEYKILDIYMPQSYITNAENELLAKATEQFNLLKQPKVSYDLKTVPEFIKSLQNPIQIGDMVNVKDIALGVDKVLRVQKKSKNLITNEVESIEIADAYEVNFASKLILDVKEIKNVVNITKLGEINYSKLGLKTTEELKNLVFDTDGYFDAGNIKPFSIETNMLSVGSRSQQLSLSSVFRINQDGNANKIDVTAGVLFSQTFEKTWNVSALVSTLPDNDYRYVYAKASKTTSAASIYLSKNQIPFDSDVNDYYFLVGILHSVVDGVRVLSITVGTTTISGGLVRTGIISSLDGQTSFNLNTGEIKGKITFSSGSSGYGNLTDKPDLSSFEQTRDYVNSTLQTDLNDLKNRADGVIESWFYSHTPSLSNLPASNWVTTEERNAHIGDTFTNMQEFVDNVTTPDAGKAWRFVKNETTGDFSWSLIANSDSTKALIEAGKAKDTADAKRRVFVSQPYPPYNIGDLWVQGNNGDIMRCKFERLSGSYVATDFEKASKYTDDTAVNNLQIGGRNLLLNTKSDWQSFSGTGYGLVVFPKITAKTNETFTARVFVRNSTSPTPITLEIHELDSASQRVKSYTKQVVDGVAEKTITTESTNIAFLEMNLYFGADYAHSSYQYEYSKPKLEKGNKATDWTPAPEDVDSAISTAQNSANIANSLLSDISNDNLLTPSEKQSTKKEWDIIVGEKSVVESQANSLGVSATSYVNAYNSLNSYITPLLADLTVNSTIVGSDFRANFKNYYDAKIALLKAVTDKLKSNTDVLKTQLDSESEKVINLENKTDFLTGTTIEGNAVATGTLLVGDGNGTNSGITGITDLENRKSVRFYAGSNYAGKNTAPWNVLDDGFMNFHHPNGNVAFEFGIVDGKFVMNGYHETGFKIFELSPNRGLVNVAYIPESWITISMFSFNQSSQTLNESSAISLIESLIIIEQTGGGQPGEDFFFNYRLNPNYSAWEYYCGTHPDYQQYQNLNGYKTLNNSRTAHIPNGWYGIKTGNLGFNYGQTRPTYNGSYTLYYVQDGRITITRVINYSI